MRAIICGGRNYNATAAAFTYLNSLHAQDPITLVIQGGAKGADAIAAKWAASRNVRCQQYDAQWALHGRSAGPIRNQAMLDDGKPDVVVVLPLGGAGTADMVARAKGARVRVVEMSA